MPKKQNPLSEANRLYARAWERRPPAAHSLPSTDLAARYKEALNADLINVLPIQAYEGPVAIIRTHEQLGEALPAIRREKILGFDTETRPNFHKGAGNPVALIQLAGENAAWLIQLIHVRFGPELAAVLGDPLQIKAGVAIHDDMRGLARIHPFAAAGVADLGRMAREAGIATVGLRSLSANLLGFRISKRVQCSNWERDILDARQIRYAATDAWLGRELYLRLLALGCSAPLPYPYHRPGRISRTGGPARPPRPPLSDNLKRKML
jgi:hypothetical protein